MRRYLRIAFSATCGVACVLLIALWVRSYFRRDEVATGTESMHSIMLASLRGEVHLMWFNSDFDYPRPWEFESRQLNKDVSFPSVSVPSWWGFRFQLTNDVSAVSAPYWSLALFAASLSATPWLRWSRRFSLRTLLIGVTLAAVVMGLIVYAARN